jgi:DNA-binding NarL/FixJ family response regulator
MEVLCLLARGLMEKEIASELNLSPYTVGNHLRNIYAKIGKNSRGEAVHWAVSSGLVSMNQDRSPALPALPSHSLE